jgi:Peptidase family C25
MIADHDDSESFTQDTQTVQAQLPAKVNASDIFVGVLGSAAAQQELLDGINSGQLLVNYLGHGSEEQWSGSDVFDTNSVGALTNGSELPVFLIMDCLNGFLPGCLLPVARRHIAARSEWRRCCGVGVLGIEPACAANQTGQAGRGERVWKRFNPR